MKWGSVGICGLSHNAFGNSYYTAPNCSDQRTINVKRRDCQRPWPNSIYHSDMCVKLLWKITNVLYLDGGRPTRGLNLGLAGYDSRMLSTRRQSSDPIRDTTIYQEQLDNNWRMWLTFYLTYKTRCHHILTVSRVHKKVGNINLTSSQTKQGLLLEVTL